MKRQGKIRSVTMVVALMCAAPLLVVDRAARAEANPQSGQISSDFNGDGWSDLAVKSEQNEMEDFEFSHGVVQIIYGSLHGLAIAKIQSWSDADFPPGEDLSANFGSAMAVGNFDGDGYSDLAVYTGPGVRIIFGSAAGLATARSQLWTRDSPGMAGDLDDSSGFGTTLAAGNFGRGPQTDLAVGARWQQCEAGAVVVMYGSGGGLSPAGSQSWSQDSPGVLGKAEGCPAGGDLFGTSLAAADFAGTGFDDLAIGAPQESLGKAEHAGSVNILRGSASGLTATGNQMWTQDTPGIRGMAESHDSFGSTLAAADFNADGFADLAAGVPTETVGRAAFAGAVNVIYGSKSGLQPRGDQFWSQSSRSVPGKAESEDTFGRSLAVGQFGRDTDNQRFADLIIGAPSEDVGRRTSAGAVLVLYGSSNRLTARGSQVWTQNTSGLTGSSEGGDLFGGSIAAGNFGRDTGLPHNSDVAITATQEQLRSGSIGAITIMHGTRRGLTAADDQFWTADKIGQGGGRHLRFGQSATAR